MNAFSILQAVVLACTLTLRMLRFKKFKESLASQWIRINSKYLIIFSTDYVASYYDYHFQIYQMKSYMATLR